MRINIIPVKCIKKWFFKASHKESFSGLVYSLGILERNLHLKFFFFFISIRGLKSKLKILYNILQYVLEIIKIKSSQNAKAVCRRFISNLVIAHVHLCENRLLLQRKTRQVKCTFVIIVWMKNYLYWNKFTEL